MAVIFPALVRAVGTVGGLGHFFTPVSGAHGIASMDVSVAAMTEYRGASRPGAQLIMSLPVRIVKASRLVLIR
jgi:hypothetical protein